MKFESTATREDDERLLHAIRLRELGWSAPQIAKRLGYPGGAHVRAMISRVFVELRKSNQ